MNKLMPVLYQAISKGVVLSVQSEKAINDTIGDHRMIVEYLEQRNAEGAKNAMRMLMQFIDVSTWERAMHYEVFRNSVQPQYCVTFDVDVTNFLSYVKKRNDSFTFSFVYAVTKCANEIQPFRCRFVDGKPAIFETIHTSFTYLNRDTELFKVVNVPMQEKMEVMLLWQRKQRRIRRTILLRRWQMIYISFHLFRGCHILIFLTRNLGEKTIQRPYSIGENSMKKMERYGCRFLCRCIIHLLTAYILENLLRSYNAV